jgi:hypothetical protein
MVFAIKLIIIHITLINVQFRYINVDAEKSPQSGVSTKGKRKKSHEKIGQFGFPLNIQGNKFVSTYSGCSTGAIEML